jgi:hypothetical protein
MMKAIMNYRSNVTVVRIETDDQTFGCRISTVQE